MRQNGASENKLCWQGAGLGVEIADFGLSWGVEEEAAVQANIGLFF